MYGESVLTDPSSEWISAISGAFKVSLCICLHAIEMDNKRITKQN